MTHVERVQIHEEVLQNTFRNSHQHKEMLYYKGKGDPDNNHYMNNTPIMKEWLFAIRKKKLKWQTSLTLQQVPSPQ